MAKLTYLVTGATGVLGSVIVKQLILDKSVDKIILLIRGKDQNDVFKKTKKLYNYWDFNSNEEELAKNKLIIYLADLSSPMFSLSYKTYTYLSNVCTNVIHSAGNISLNTPLSLLIKEAMDDIHNILTFCKDSGSKLEYVSTVGVGGKAKEVTESLQLTPRLFNSDYEKYKREVEAYIAYSMTYSPFYITIHRPSAIIGESTTGKLIGKQAAYHTLKLLSGEKLSGISINIPDFTADTVPVDYVAAVIIWSSKQDSKTAGLIFNLSTGKESLSLNSFVELYMKEADIKEPKRIPIIIYRILLNILIILGINKSRYKAMLIILNHLKDNKVIFNNIKTISFLRKHGGPVLPDQKDFLKTYFKAISKKPKEIKNEV